MLILGLILFAVILLVVAGAAYFVFDDLEVVIWPSIVVAAISAGGISVSLSQYDRMLIVGCVVLLAVAIVLAAYLISRSRGRGGPDR